MRRIVLVAALALAMLATLLPGTASAASLDKYQVAISTANMIADIRDMGVNSMVSSYGTTCYNDLSGIPDDGRKKICFLKAKDIIGGTKEGGFQPFQTADRARGAIIIVRGARWVEHQAGANPIWLEGTRGCDVWSDIACGTVGSAPTGELYQNNIERAGCDSQNARFCPNLNLQDSTFATWRSKIDGRLD